MIFRDILIVLLYLYHFKSDKYDETITFRGTWKLEEKENKVKKKSHFAN